MLYPCKFGGTKGVDIVRGSKSLNLQCGPVGSKTATATVTVPSDIKGIFIESIVGAGVYQDYVGMGSANISVNGTTATITIQGYSVANMGQYSRGFTVNYAYIV